MEKFARIAKWVCVGLFGTSLGLVALTFCEILGKYGARVAATKAAFSTRLGVAWLVFALFWHLMEEQAARRQREMES